MTLDHRLVRHVSLASSSSEITVWMCVRMAGFLSSSDARSAIGPVLPVMAARRTRALNAITAFSYWTVFALKMVSWTPLLIYCRELFHALDIARFPAIRQWKDHVFKFYKDWSTLKNIKWWQRNAYGVDPLAMPSKFVRRNAHCKRIYLCILPNIYIFYLCSQFLTSDFKGHLWSEISGILDGFSYGILPSYA